MRLFATGLVVTWRNNGDTTLVWAKAFTEDAVPIFGVPFAWTLAPPSRALAALALTGKRSWRRRRS